MKKRKLFTYLPIIFLLAGCVTTAKSGLRIGTTEHRRLIILGEHIPDSTAKDYANKYNSLVYYTPSRGAIADSVSSSLRGTLGPSSAMRSLIEELKSINNTDGFWKLIVPKVAERYFLVTLKNMGDNSISNAKGEIILPESQKNQEIEMEIKRVTNGSFIVNYGR
jgi:hypothetical protein